MRFTPKTSQTHVAVLAAFLSATACNRPATTESAASVLVWGAARWNMTPQEIERAFAGKAKRQVLPGFEPDNWNLNIDGVEVGRDKTKMAVHFRFDDKGKLNGITMTLAPEERGLLLSLSPLLQELEQDLTLKYGPPAFQKRPDLRDAGASFDITELSWSLPQTIIRLHALQFRSLAQMGANMFSVSYERREDQRL